MTDDFKAFNRVVIRKALADLSNNLKETFVKRLIMMGFGGSHQQIWSKQVAVRFRGDSFIFPPKQEGLKNSP
jgi:hypothetical protein